jgi:hypothetical protein
MLDEISVRQNMQFSQKFGCSECFETLGSWGMASNLMNHGLCQKWKQPVAYCMIHSSTKAEMLTKS